jgi:hypothetical protein
MEHAAGTEGRQYHRQGEVTSENVDVRVAFERGDRIPGSKQNVVPRPAILAQCNFAIGSPINVVEYGPRNATLRKCPKIVDIYRSLNSQTVRR